MANEVATQKDVKEMNARELVEYRMPEIAKALPQHIPSDKFQRVFQLAVMREPKILRCEPRSVLESVQKAAADGLVLDGREAALVVFNARVKNGANWDTVAKAQYIPMIGGILKRARNSGEISSIQAIPVYAGELSEGRFKLQAGTNPSIQHDPLLVGDRGPVALVYSVCKLKDGTVDIDWMTRDEIEAIRARSRAKDAGPWVTDWLEMAKKTVLRRHSKKLPMDSDLARIFQRVDDLYDFNSRPQVESKPVRGAAKALQIAQERDEGGEVDEDTGEVTKPASGKRRGKDGPSTPEPTREQIEDAEILGEDEGEELPV